MALLLLCITSTVIMSVVHLVFVRFDGKGCDFCRGRLQDSTMVHDEEAEISIRLAILIANTQRNRSAMQPLPLKEPQAPGTAAAAHGNVAPKTEAFSGILAASLGIIVASVASKSRFCDACNLTGQPHNLLQ